VARKHIEPRQSYILVKIIGEESEDVSTTYASLLDNIGDKVKFSGMSVINFSEGRAANKRYWRG
jgi:hypothetical protein